MSDSIYQTFLLLATFNIALISVAIANFAVSASFLGRETRLSRSRMERRRQKLLLKMKELGETSQIGDIQKELDETKKAISGLMLDIFFLSWLGAVILPSVGFFISFIMASVGMNLDSLVAQSQVQSLQQQLIAFSSMALAGGFFLLLVVIYEIDSAARKTPIPEFEVRFPDLSKITKIKSKTPAVITVSLANNGEDMGEKEQILVNFPPEFEVMKSIGEYQICKQGVSSDNPNFTSAIVNSDFHHIGTTFNLRIQVMSPSDKKLYKIPIDIYERKTGRTKLELAIEVID